MSLKLVVPGTFSDATLPKYRDDPVLPDAGALALFELAHPINPVAGVPANAAHLPNLAYAQAKALYPAGDATTLGADMFVGAAFDTAVGGVASVRERTAKGGLHLAAPTTGSGDVTRRAYIALNAGIIAYINANPSHSYFTSMWGRVTRIGQSSGGIDLAAIGAAFQIAQFYNRPTGAASSGAAVYPISGGYKIGSRAYGAVGNQATDGSSKADTGPFLYTSAVGSVASTVTTGLFAKAGDVSAGSAAGVSRYNGVVFYRLYLEDLTASGRSYATVDALVFAEYTKQVLTAGGRYYGDTFTAAPA